MQFLMRCFDITPFIIIPSVLLVIISLSVNNKKVSNVLFTIGISTSGIYVFFLMGIVVPSIFLGGLFENAIGIILMFSIICIVWLVITLFLKLKNRLIIFSHNEKEIYIRDINVKYSPAVLSYLMNNKIETKKDFPATLLNLCVENVLKIEKDKMGFPKFIDLKNEEKVKELTTDEKYAYEMITTGVTGSKILTWKNKVEEEYNKFKFSKIHKINLGSYLLYLYIAMIVIVWIFALLVGVEELNNINFAYIIFTTFIAAWEMVIFAALRSVMNSIFKKNDKTEFLDTYTRKGALEYNKWKKFEKFIREFTLVKEKEAESITILGKYLSYSIALGINKNCDQELYNLINKSYSFDYNVLYKMFSEEKIKEIEK